MNDRTLAIDLAAGLVSTGRVKPDELIKTAQDILDFLTTD